MSTEVCVKGFISKRNNNGICFMNRTVLDRPNGPDLT